MCSTTVSGLKEELRKEVQGGEREGGGTDMQGEGSRKSIRGVEEPVLSNNYAALSLHYISKTRFKTQMWSYKTPFKKNILVPIHKIGFLQ